MTYVLSTTIELPLQAFYKAGLMPEEVRGLIEHIRDPADPRLCLRCRPCMTEDAWKVDTAVTDAKVIHSLVQHIEKRLNAYLQAVGEPEMSK